MRLTLEANRNHNQEWRRYERADDAPHRDPHRQGDDNGNRVNLVAPPKGDRLQHGANQQVNPDHNEERGHGSVKVQVRVHHEDWERQQAGDESTERWDEVQNKGQHAEHPPQVHLKHAEGERHGAAGQRRERDLPVHVGADVVQHALLECRLLLQPVGLVQLDQRVAQLVNLRDIEEPLHEASEPDTELIGRKQPVAVDVELVKGCDKHVVMLSQLSLDAAVELLVERSKPLPALAWRLVRVERLHELLVDPCVDIARRLPRPSLLDDQIRCKENDDAKVKPRLRCRGCAAHRERCRR